MGDVLLKEVSDCFARLALDLTALLADLLTHKTGMKRQAQLVRHLLFLQWRSRDVLNEFAEFYCVRLLLDHQSPLATYFIDLFSQLEWMLEILNRIYSPLQQEAPPVLGELCRSMGPAIETCRLLYAAYRMLPRSTTLQGLDEQTVVETEFKREGRNGRRFSCNKFHCQIRGLGFVNLDRQGTSMVCLSEKLGEGGFATVYRGDFEDIDENGRTTHIGDPVAVKMFSNNKSDSSKFSSRLRQSMEHITQHHEQSMTLNCGVTEDDPFSLELRRLVSVRHPNIVTPRGYIGKRQHGESGLVMELMDESLHDYLEKVNRRDLPPLQEFDMLDLMLEIAKGMRFLHECNLIHRDLKPKNVLLRLSRGHKDQGCKLLEVKLADFGLSKLCDFSQAGGSTMCRQTSFQGTSCYMAPELRVRGHVPSQESPYQMEKVDVFSYGTTCFNILVGNPDALSFSSQSAKVFYESVKTGEWKQWVQGIDEHVHYLVKLIARCWEWEPTRRPTFAALCALLQHAMQYLLDRDTTCCPKVPLGKLRYSEVYNSIIEGCPRAVGGVKVIKKYLLDFESICSAKPPPTNSNRYLQMAHGKVARWIFSGIIGKKGSVKESDFERLLESKLETSDFARDVSIGLKAMRNQGLILMFASKRAEDSQGLKFMSALKRAEDSQGLKFIHASQDLKFIHAKRPAFCQFMNDCLDKQDPVDLIKGLACFKMMAHRFYIKRSKTYEEYGFDFQSDQAFCELEVDQSLIPLLVTFWLSNFDQSLIAF